MDFEEKKKRQLVRVIIAEAGMVLSVIAIVVVAVLAAMGFMISSNGEIEQSGLMQLHTVPTGATVTIDGSTLFSRTNLSRTLTAGTHKLELSREGYDSWQKEVSIHAGVLMRLYYPRLFLQNRKVVAAKTLSENGLEFYAPSQNHNYILYAEKKSSQWQLLDIRGDDLKTTPLDLSGVLPGMVEVTSRKASAQGIGAHNYEFAGEIEELIWSANEEKVLVKVTYQDVAEWVLVNLRNIAESVNITRTFGLGDVHVEMIDGAATRLYILDGRQLKRINTVDRVMSRVLLDNVLDFESYGSSVIYVAETDQKERFIGVYRDDEQGGTVITNAPQDKAVKIAISNYYDEDYLIYALDDEINVLYGRIPNYSEEGAKLTDLKELVSERKLKTTPDELSVSADGEFVVARKAAQYMVMDLDMGDLYEYEAPSSVLKWFGTGMMYTVKDGEILVWDFDGTNQRNLAKSTNKEADADNLVMVGDTVTATSNGRWIYYLMQDADKVTVLAREQIRE